jgi:hypothetical protein
VRAAVPLAADARDSVAAVLRWRAWWLGHHLPGRLQAAARLFPVMLQTSFPVPELSGEAPGVAGLRFRRRWSALARAIGLPPPNRMQRGRSLVETVLAVPTPDGLEVLVLVSADARPDELRAVEDRVQTARAFLTAAGAPLRAGVLPPSRLAADVGAALRTLAFGGVLAGRLSAAAWDALEEGSRRPFDVELAATLAASAPTPFSALALTLLSRHPTPGPLPVMLGLLLSGEPARAIADPDAFALRWAGEISGLRPLLEKTARFSWLDGPTDPADLRAMVLLGRTLALSCAGAMRRVRGSLDRLGWRLWREALGPDMPRVLLPALGRHLRSLAAQGRLQLEPVRSGRGYEVRLPDGTALGRGSGPVQARVRALGLCAQAWAAGGDDTALVQGFSRLDPTWRALGRRLAQPRDRAARVLVVEAGSVSHAGPPFDVLNRGLERTMEFEGAVAVTIAPGRRPSGRVFSPVETVEALLQRAAGESPVELFASRPESRPMATRLGQMAALLRAAAEEAVAVEAGGRVYIRLRQGVRRYALDRFAARPRCFTPDPESPDLSAGAGERPARASHPPGMLACRVTLASKQDAAVIYSDGCGGHLRERVPLAELEEHLRETRSIVRAAHPAAVLTVRLSGDLEPEVRRAGQLRQSMPVVVRGELPWVEVEVGGERFGGDSMVGWATAAEVLLAFSRPDDQVRIGVSAVAATIQGGPATPLLSIWAASVARRRLRTRLARVLDAYREAASRRRAT